MKDLSKYKEYTIEEFVMDDDFQEIVNHKNSELNIDDLIQRYSNKKREIRLASYITKALKVVPAKQDSQKIKKSWQIIEASRRKPLILSKQIRIAATLLAIISLSVVVFYQVSTNKVTDKLSEDKPLNAELILSNGESIEINSPQSTISYSSDGAGIVVNDSTEISQENSRESFNQLVVPFGKQSYVELSDGSKVWLNSGSKLIFPPVFSGRERVVELEGEGFFKVAKNTESPFFVKTDHASLKVYGTEFNFRAYHSDETYSIVLIEGSISLKTAEVNREIFVEPSQKATIDLQKSEIEINDIENSDSYTAWKDGYLIFVNEDVSEVLKRVSRYYNIKLSCDKNARFEKVYGKLDLKTDFTKVLDGLAFISDASYERRGDEYVYINKTK